jgi:polar amino acid transport system substrate-binding protein
MFHKLIIPLHCLRHSAVLLCLIFWVVSLPPLSCHGQAPLVLSTFAGPPLSNQEGTGFYDQVLLEAFARAGVAVEIIQLPAERSLRNVNQGITDGDFVRIAGLDTLYPDILQVAEKIDDFEFVGFAKNGAITTTGWESLTPYDVAIVRGWKILENNIQGVRSLVRTKNQRLLFTLLENNRADIVVYSRFEGCEMLRQLGINDVTVLNPPLAVREMFLYLHKKHQDLAPVIAGHLRQMKADGTFAAIRTKTLAPLLQGTDCVESR